jgi:hypothetical protein
MKTLQTALQHQLWVEHKIGDRYVATGTEHVWRIAYYPILENGKTGEKYDEPRALMERPISGGIDFREMPLRYLKRI